MRTTSPGLKRLRQTASQSAVLPCRINSVDVALRSITSMRTRWLSSYAVIILRGTVSGYHCVQLSSIHWFYTRIIVIAACSVRTEMWRYDKPASRRPTIIPHLNSLKCQYCALQRRWISFHVSTSFGSSALIEQSITLILLMTQYM